MTHPTKATLEVKAPGGHAHLCECGEVRHCDVPGCDAPLHHNCDACFALFVQDCAVGEQRLDWGLAVAGVIAMVMWAAIAWLFWEGRP